jgi:hypothetical protein
MLVVVTEKERIAYDRGFKRPELVKTMQRLIDMTLAVASVTGTTP